MPGDDSDAVKYDIQTIGERLVSQYSGLSFVEIEELRYDVYLLILRDAFIYERSKTEEGREYLENCWILEQTEPDKKRLRKKFGEGG